MVEAAYKPYQRRRELKRSPGEMIEWLKKEAEGQASE